MSQSQLLVVEIASTNPNPFSQLGSAGISVISVFEFIFINIFSVPLLFRVRVVMSAQPSPVAHLITGKHIKY